MTILRKLASPSLAAAALIAGLGVAAAGETGSSAPQGQDRGTGASGKGDVSGMGQDNTEMGKPKGPGDKVEGMKGGMVIPGAASPEQPVQPKNCDDGRPPVNGACPN